jgi:hypothetical protein
MRCGTFGVHLQGGAEDFMSDANKAPGKPVQALEDGAGPTYHRTYAVDLDCSFADAKRTMEKFKGDPNALSPQLMATFEKITGQPGSMSVGDEFHIHISGPWDGPVRVADVKPLSFTLSTLKGHMEAGRIQFRICESGPKGARFEIESVARSKDSIVDFLYDKLPFAKIAQRKMWELTCEAFYEDATGIKRDPEQEDDKLVDVEVTTEKREGAVPQPLEGEG